MSKQVAAILPPEEWRRLICSSWVSYKWFNCQKTTFKQQKDE